MSDFEATIVAESLCKRFKGPDGGVISALDHVSLRVERGALTALVGPDGAGKTTFMRMIAGLLRPDGGSLHVLGIDVSKKPQVIQNRISYMPQRFGLYEDLSIQENLDLYADLHGVPKAERKVRFARMLEMTDLSRFTARPAGKLSGGMKQKLGLACTLVRSPDLLLLDEPSVGVDPLSRRDLWQIVQQLVEDEHLSVIINTAYMDEAERCAKVFVMNRGQILAEDSPQAITARSDGLSYIVTPEKKSPARQLQARLIDAPDLIIDAVPRGGDVWFTTKPETKQDDIASLLGPLCFGSRPCELEDSFMMLLRQHEDAEREQSTMQDRAEEVEDSFVIEQVGSDGAKPVIVVRDLVRKFGSFTAVASTSFEVSKGEIFGLLGPNGAGKTTTFRMLCGLLPATSGHLEVAGLNLRKARAAARTRIGYVSQKFSLYGDLTVHENMKFFGGVYGLRGSALSRRIATLLKQFELDPSAKAKLLPAGYKQRLAMATAFIHEPDILFLDEPTSGIDPLARRSFWRTITRLAQSGVTIVITTHFMEEAEYCDRIAIQDAGHLLALGSPKQVREMAGADGAMDMNSAFVAIVEQSRHDGEGNS